MMTMVFRAYHFDEAMAYEPVQVTLRLITDGIDSLSTVGSFPIGWVSTVTMFIFFFIFSYRYMLPGDARAALLGTWPSKQSH